MGIIDGITAAKMLEISGQSVVSGLVDINGRLILSTRGGPTIDAGVVKGSDGKDGTPANGEVSAIANSFVYRDANGRSQFINPVSAQDAATKNYVDGLSIADAQLPARLRAGSTAQIIADANDALESGWYQGPNVAHAPDASWYHFEVVKHFNPGYVHQRAMHYFEQRTFERTQIGGTWTAWVRVATQDDLNALNAYRGANLPAFMGTFSSDLTQSGTAHLSVLVADSLVLNNRSCYNTSNGRFTAPVSGFYSFSIFTCQSTNTTGPELHAFVNGGTYKSYIAIGYFTAYMTFGATLTVYLAAGSYFDFRLNNNNNSTFTLEASRTTMSGHYLG